MHKLHQAARNYAARGIPIFPCEPGSKKPMAGGKGFHDATTDLSQIDAWWGAKPYNVAFSPASIGLGIVDLDGREAREHWETLQIEHGFAPDTWTVQTPRGVDHLHLYFKGVLPMSAGRLAPHIDTRGVGSYALLPPSTVGDSEYVVVTDLDAAELPDWIVPTLDKLRARTAAKVEQLDLPANLYRASRYLAGRSPAIEGQSGNQRTYDTACALLDLGLSEEATFKLIVEEWNPRCDPPWEEDELQTLVTNAASYAQNEAGAWAVPPVGEVFGSVLDKLDPKYTAPAARSRFYPYDEDEQDAMPEPSWIVPGYIPAYSTVMLYGERETFKSFLALDVSLSLAAGLPYASREAGRPLPVVFVAGEGPRSVSRQRRPAWRLARSVEGSIPFHLVQAMPLVAMPEQFEEFIQAIRAKEVAPGLIVLDTLSRAMAGQNENDAKDASLFIEAVEAIKREFNCTVLVIHHAGHGNTGHSRGSSALEGGFDAVFEVKAERDTKAVALRCTKMKDADHPRPLHFEMRQIGPSIVPFPISDRSFKLLNPGDDKAAQNTVSAALSKLGAVDQAHSVTTRVLASELLPASPDENQEEREENVSRVARALQAKAKASLSAFARGMGRDLLWSLAP